jgi:hypothetical protein
MEAMGEDTLFRIEGRYLAEITLKDSTSIMKEGQHLPKCR